MSNGIDDLESKGYCLLYGFIGILMFFALVYYVYEGNFNGLN